MIHFLALQNSYHDVQVGLFHNLKQIDILKTNKIEASKLLAPMIEALLEKNQEDFSRLKFIAASHGPGPFTTLRTVLATINGLSFATGLPLIGVDSLEALAHEMQDAGMQAAHIPLVVLLNAFNNDVYFLISHGFSAQRGCKKAEILITELVEQFSNGPIRFAGNGTTMHKEFILNTFGPRAIIPEPIPESPYLATIAHMAFAKWERQEGLVKQLLPVYLK